MPEMIFVDSTGIEAIGFDPERMELHVRYAKTGETYIYYGVEEWTFREFLEADSKGTYLNTQIKGRFEFGKL